MTRPTGFSLMLFITAAALARNFDSEPFDLTWHTLDGGGATSSGGGFQLFGSAGQPDAGGPMSGGAFMLVGGFWPGTGSDTCLADITGNGLIDIDDLLAVVTGWGQCANPCPPLCPADIVPHSGNCLVDIDDLLAVITDWGACP